MNTIVPGSVLNHQNRSLLIDEETGEFDLQHGIEKSRIKVTIASGIPRERCEQVNLDYYDPKTIDVQSWEGREEEGILVVHRAGEVSYRLGSIS